MSEKKCPMCGTEFEGNFCPNCGAKWGEEKNCPKCGTKLAGSARFCNECGYSFAPQAPSPQPGIQSAKGWVHAHKKQLKIASLLLIVVILFAVVLPVSLANRYNGTYYRYLNEAYDYSSYITIKGNTWEQDGMQGTIERKNGKVIFSMNVLGFIEQAEGTIKGGVITMEGSNVVYAKKGKLPDGPITYARSSDRKGYTVTGLREGTNYTYIVIPSTYEGRPVISIGNRAFYDSNITGIEIPDSITSIGAEAFCNCSGLTSIKIPDSVTAIGEGAFRGCAGLTSIEIPDGVTTIRSNTFNGCAGLTSIEIPDSVTSIGSGAFKSTAYCNEERNWENDVLYIGKHFIQAREKLSGQYIMRSDTKTIAGGAFINCGRLTDIVIPDGVTSIGDSAFSGCSSLTNIVIPDSVTSIGGAAFNGCSHLASVIIGNGVTSIESSTFSRCYSLTSIVIPDSVTSIGDSAFSGCSSLESIHYEGTKSQWRQITKKDKWNKDTGNYVVYCSDGATAKA